MEDSARRLERWTRAGELVRETADGQLECLACAHRCRLADGRAGRCRVRVRRGGALRVPGGYVGARALDPVEKKPFFHLLPGADTLTFGMLGCSFGCSFCQNWFVSQSLRDPGALARGEPMTPGALAEEAREAGARLVVSSYNEPLITAEWAREVFREARARGLATAMVSNGAGTPEVLDYLADDLDAFKVDLKGFRADAYRSLGGDLAAVKETLAALVASPVWVEVVTVVIPGWNDGEDELAAMAGYLAGLDPDLPWHVHGFRPDYRMRDRPATPVETVMAVVEAGRRAGLRFVYPGLVAGLAAGVEDTRCPACAELLVRRGGMRSRQVWLERGCCPACGEAIPGRFEG